MGIGTYLFQPDNYVGKTRSQKFDLRIRFITLLNASAREWERARAIARLF